MKAAVQQLGQPVSDRKAIIIVAAVVALLLLGWGGWVLHGKITAKPATPEEVKRAIRKYLAKMTGHKEFKSPLDVNVASVANGAAIPMVITTTNVVTTTNKAGRVRTVNRVSKTTKGGLPETAFSVYFRTNQAQTETYEQMYRLIGEQLAVADQLLASGDPRQELTALVMASEASDYARTNTSNLWLGARICEGYLWPNLSLVETTNRSPFDAETLLNRCDTAFQEAGETNNIIRNYEYLIAKSKKPAQREVACYRLAHIYQDLGEYAKAVALLKQIKSYRMTRVPQEIAFLERRLQRK
jgi:hypothetical protein